MLKATWRAVTKAACGSVVETRSTKGSFSVDICSECHPFYTGKQKIMDTAGRVERFQKRYAKKAKPKASLESPQLSP